MANELAIQLSDGPTQELVRIHTDRTDWGEPDVRYLRRKPPTRSRSKNLDFSQRNEEFILTFGNVRLWIQAEEDQIRIVLRERKGRKRKAKFEIEPTEVPCIVNAPQRTINPDCTGDFTPESNSNAGTCPAEQPGQYIGPYKLLHRLGEGGMGTVWVAEQERPFKRQVAVKLVKAGMDSADVIRRFEAERQALALMDHPNIAKVLDAGTTAAGRPYFVMELVKGIPITTFCDTEHLTLRERLELFVPVCQAVQHAHQRGIIHRDLKPSNVLVAFCDGKPMPKIIDFGVAKATCHKLSESSIRTQVGQIVGTWEYMAPEQAEINNLDIDPRADIYSLGVILYELLAGSPPFTSKQLRDSVFCEMLRMIREVEPPTPSTRLASSKRLHEIAAHRKMAPPRLVRSVQGDLDWIVMKALEKNRCRRYESAYCLAMDIQRYLAGQSVLAGPPGLWSRIRNFTRKHRAFLVIATLIELLLAGFAFVTARLAAPAFNPESIVQR
jgi:serine/threonine protein kinase